MIILALAAVTLFVAYANGANDNFKGVATLFGANVTSYERALWIATLATFAGCMASLFVARGLVVAFSGRGLVPDGTAASPVFLLAVASGAGATVMLATRLGFPVSTTHGLTGALVGAGFAAAGDALNLRLLGAAFVLPLLVSPVLAALITIPLYKIAHALLGRLGITRRACLCIAPGQFVPLAASVPRACAPCGEAESAPPALSAGTAPACVEKYDGEVIGVTAQTLADNAHYVSAAAVSFARGLNDAPKIAALLMAARAFDTGIALTVLAAAMALGGWLNARKVAETMSKKISEMSDGPALTANLVTAFLVIFASRFGLPVSTTHVSVGSIAGIGLVNGSAHRSMIAAILASWVLTLPVAAIAAAMAYAVLARIL
jgi:inorganic phosphate transporter, PiT family